MELSRDERERILNQKLHQLTREGYVLQSSTATSASLLKPKPPSAFGANLTLTCLTLGIWLIVWLPLAAIRAFAFLGKKQDSVFVEVLADGTVEITTEGLLGGTAQDMSHVPKPPTEYDDADFVMATTRGKLYLLPDRLELWKGKNFQRSLPRDQATYSEGNRWESFIIRDSAGETWLDDKSSMFKKDRAKVRQYLGGP